MPETEIQTDLRLRSTARTIAPRSFPWVYVGLAAWAALVRLPWFFLQMNRDSGMFAYGGWRILHGALPYVDFWDNKLPGVFYLNALAIKLFGPSQAGLIVFQIIYASLTAWAFYAVARRLCGKRAALIASVLFVFYHGGFGLSEDGNYTEIYLALPSLLAVLIVLKFGKNPPQSPIFKGGGRGGWGLAAPFAAGLLVAAAAFIKQPAASLGGALILFVLFRQRPPSYRSAASVVAGLGFGAAAALVWMRAAGILPDAIEANLVFNRLYLQDAYTYGLEGSVWNLYCGLVLVALPLAGALFGMMLLRRRRFREPGIAWLLAAWFILDLIGVAMGGRFCNHYFITMLVSSLLLTGTAIDAALTSKRGRLLAASLGIVLFFGPVWSASGSSPRSQMIPLRSIAQRDYAAIRWIVRQRLGEGYLHPSETAAAWIRERTAPSDTIYVWGWDTRIGFLAQRAFPSRYLHAHPLGATGFDRDRRIMELVSSLEKARPIYIVDGSGRVASTVPPLSPGPLPPSSGPFFRLDGYEPVQEFVSREYRAVENVDGYIMYERNDRSAAR